jgi:hypothetical protein
LTITSLDIISLTYAASFTLQVRTALILSLREALRVPANPQREITIVPPLWQRTDRSATGSSNSLELKSDGYLQCGSTHDPHPNCAGTERVQTLAGTAGDTDGLSENVASHCASQVQLTAHANGLRERLMVYGRGYFSSRLALLFVNACEILQRTSTGYRFDPDEVVTSLREGRDVYQD